MTEDDGNHDGRSDPEESVADETQLFTHSPVQEENDIDYTEPHERTDSTTGHRYLIGEIIGEGGMAEVYHATDVQLQRAVAVKRLRPEYAAHKEARHRFFAEAEILANLDHPGATSVFEAGLLPDGDCFYAMKQVRGRTLRELMNERIPDDVIDRSNRAHFIEIFTRACEAVAAAHKQGIIHRDLKPENIMVDDLDVVYVMDWGLAKQLDEDHDGTQSDCQRTRLGDVMGTPAYMSPEQASGRAATSDRQTDVFSLGVMLYEILTGVNPFRGQTAVDSMKGVMYHEPDPPRKHNPRVSRMMSAITMKALDKDPFRRYHSAAELVEDLRRHREFLPVSAIAPTKLERLANWSRRRPRLAAILATLAVVTVVAGLAMAFQASVENARVAAGYGFIDEIESNLSSLDSEIATLTAQLQHLKPGPKRQAIANRLADLEAQFEMAEKDRMALSLAITGFTILSPEDRARRIVRETIWDNIDEHIEVGDLYRARAEIQFALRYFEGGNLFGFSEDDGERLRDTLARINREIAANEQATGEEAGVAGTGPDQ